MNEKMKTYTAILIGVVILIVVVLGGYLLTKNNSRDNGGEQPIINEEEISGMNNFSGEVIRVFEGENTLRYSFNIPETATTSLSMDNALIRVSDNGMPYATIYISYEGGRGYSATDYINNIIIPNVSSVVRVMDVVTIGGYTWQTAESLGSEWRVLTQGPWLIVVENKKDLHESVDETLSSIVLK